MSTSTDATGTGTPTLEDMSTQITNLAEQIRTIKQSSTPDKEALKSHITQLQTLKKDYASLNNGIGIDGLPFVEPLSKAEKKKKEKEEKRRKLEEEQQKGGGKKEEVDGGEKKLSKNAAKKAAQKAAKKAAKTSAKSTNDNTTEVNDNNKEGNKPPVTSSTTVNNKITKDAVKHLPPKYLPPTKTLQPLQISFNPNATQLNHRPVVTLTVASLLDVSVDLTVLPDRFRSNPALGMVDGGGEVVGDLAMARYLLRLSSNNEIGSKGGDNDNNSASHLAIVDQWVDYSLQVNVGNDNVNNNDTITAICNTLDSYLQSSNSTYLVGQSPTLADISIFNALGFPSQVSDRVKIEEQLTAADASEGSKRPCVRWMHTISSLPAIREATVLALAPSNIEPSSFDDNGSQFVVPPLVRGMSPLPGALPNHVVTRFPPEPSGYLHIGHAKALLMNDYYATRYNGRMILRFDDTNPSKEKDEYQQSIIEDMKTLEVYPDTVSFTSDYFEVIREYALYLIDNGLAFMDDTTQVVMQKERMDRVESKHRNMDKSEVKRLFLRMCDAKDEEEKKENGDKAKDKDKKAKGKGKDVNNSGKKADEEVKDLTLTINEAPPSQWCLRAKINMASVNGTMRDPVIFRRNSATPHHRTGTTYRAYPTYDLACPIVDSIEGVTHALRTTEYNDRDEQYQWMQRSLNVRRVRIHSFSRMEFRYATLSKRKLSWFVENNKVSGWDDARFPTVRGTARRGVAVQALRSFIYSQGASKRVVNMEWNKFWAENKKVLDLKAKRYMAISRDNHVKLVISNLSDEDAYVTAPYHPKHSGMGTRAVKIGCNVILESIDVLGLQVGEEIVLLRWGVIKITEVVVAGDDEKVSPMKLSGEFLPNGDIKAAKRKLSWIAIDPTTGDNHDDSSTEQLEVELVEFDNLISKEKLEDGEDFKDHLNPSTMASSIVIGNAGLIRNTRKNEIVQLERRGYFRVDTPRVGDNRPVLFMVPDGKAKAMGGLTGKLAHR